MKAMWPSGQTQDQESADSDLQLLLGCLLFCLPLFHHILIFKHCGVPPEGLWAQHGGGSEP